MARPSARDPLRYDIGHAVRPRPAGDLARHAAARVDRSIGGAVRGADPAGPPTMDRLLTLVLLAARRGSPPTESLDGFLHHRVDHLEHPSSRPSRRFVASRRARNVASSSPSASPVGARTCPISRMCSTASSARSWAASRSRADPRGRRRSALPKRGAPAPRRGIAMAGHSTPDAELRPAAGPRAASA